MNTMSRPILKVNLDALSLNWQRIRACFTGQVVGAVVKHDAYGLGLQQVVQALALSGCQHFWVDTPESGLAVRAALPEATFQVQVFVLCGLAGLEIADHAAHGLIPVLHSLDDINHVKSHSRCAATPYSVAIQLDTGLTRLGLQESDLYILADIQNAFDGFHITDWVTQLSRFDAPLDPVCVQQRHLFECWTKKLPLARRCVTTSSGMFADQRLHFDHARVGSALYGIDTSRDMANPMDVVATLTAPVLQVLKVPAGTSIGYGGQFRTRRPSVFATVAAGYGDGLPVSFGYGGQVSVHGQLAPAFGGIAMGLLSVDITDLPVDFVKVGESVELYGSSLELRDVAARLGLTPAAVLVPSAIKAERRYQYKGGVNPNS